MTAESPATALNDHYTCRQIFDLCLTDRRIRLTDSQRSRIQACRDYLDKTIQQPDAVFYGINTGFGALCNTVIPPHQLEELQSNLVRSHATGMGDDVPAEVVRIMLLLKVLSLSGGYSGVRTEVVDRLLDLFNHGLTPRVFQLGSLGASGDLAPLAHIALTLLGEGEFRAADGSLIPASEALARYGLGGIALKSKEGLALLNGTQFMSAYGTWLVAHSQHLYQWAQAIAALSCEAFLASEAPFHPAIHRVRPHPGQIASAESIRRWRAGSRLAGSSGRVQDAYSFRCIPQVHGASLDTIHYVERVFETEINAVTDNPNIFPDEDLILSGGNFHGQPLALALDFLAIALAELGNISERRSYLLLSGANDRPMFLAQTPGLESGLMIAQYTAAAIVSANKQLCTPASVDSVPSSNGQEDHVSMGANAATKAYRVAENIYRLLAVEFMAAYTALGTDRRADLAPALLPLIQIMESEIRPGSGDRYLSPELRRCEDYLRHHEPPQLA